METVIQILMRVARENEINCTGPGEVGCCGRTGWHTWSEHRLHVADSQAMALIEAGLLTPDKEN